MFKWDPQTIGWYADAVGYTGFDRELADRLQPYLKEGETVCDLGCGIGYLALELARRGYEVTAVDRSEAALAWLEQERGREGLENLSLLQRDWDSLEPLPMWDSVIMVGAGGGHEFDFYRRFCRKRLILVDRIYGKSPAVEGGRKDLLSSVPPDGKTDRFALEFGQPFRSLDEVEEFQARYRNKPHGQKAAERLVETGQKDFPLYMPYRKELALLVIPAG